MIVVIDERLDLLFQITGSKVVLQQYPALQLHQLTGSFAASPFGHLSANRVRIGSNL